MGKALTREKGVGSIQNEKEDVGQIMPRLLDKDSRNIFIFT